MQQRILYAVVSFSLVAFAFGCSESKPLSPTIPTPPSTTGSGGATLKVTAPSLVAPTGDVRLTTFTNPTLSAGAVSSTEGASVSPQYRFQLFNESGQLVEESVRSTTSWTPTANLDFDKRYSWQVRAELDGDAGPWSSRESFLTAQGSFQRGQEVFDLLTNGRTVGHRIGGQFVAGGWQATSFQDGIDYDIPTCNACTIEFDVTGFGRGEGRQVMKDLKWLSMGDGSTWGNFGAFRNHPWKMHLEQRGDGNGTGMKLIWRTAGHADDNDTKIDPTSVNWRQSGVFHFVVTWDPGGYSISVGEIQNGQLVANQVWFRGGFARVYAPPNHRISLGTRSRSETLEGTYRNVRIYPGPPRPR
jgi:hypothetical protein